jgi:hypothetical protein
MLAISHFCRLRTDFHQTDHIYIQTEDQTHVLKNDFLELYKHLNIDYSKYFKMDALSKYGILAAEFALKFPFKNSQYSETQVGIVLSNATGSLDTDAEFQKTINNKDNFFPSPAIFVYTLSNIVMGELCIKYKIKGENMFFLSESIPTQLLESYVLDLFERKKIETAVVGWVECTNGQPDVLLLLVEKNTITSHVGVAFTSTQIELLYQL